MCDVRVWKNKTIIQSYQRYLPCRRRNGKDSWQTNARARKYILENHVYIPPLLLVPGISVR